MRTILTQIAFLIGCLALSACGSDFSEKDRSFTKEDAKNTPTDEDLCDIYNWYGDGQCDLFCLNDDPDCGTNQCNGLPSCQEGAYEVATCAPGAECTEVTVCGTTIVCEFWNNCEDDVPVRLCEDGYELVDACTIDDCYETVGSCGARQLFCQALVSSCEAYPSCPQDTYEVEACFAGEECFEETLCGYSIYCKRDLDTCDAIPVCADGYVEMATCPSDRNCYEETVCGTTISCSKVSECDTPAPPMCPEGYYLIDSCPSDSNCYSEEVCGLTISCMEGTINCLLPPECPPGTRQVEWCDPERPCAEIIECGMRLYCETDVG